MTRILSVHSFRGGTGKSNLSANLAAAFAARGLRVGVFDTDLASPGIHVLFGFTAGPESHTLNDHIQGSILIEKCSHDVTPASMAGGKGRIFLVPAAMEGDRKPGCCGKAMKSSGSMTPCSASARASAWIC